MQTFYNSKGEAFNLSREIGRGGEGKVYLCADRDGIVGKIYHEPIGGEKADKLAWMAANTDEHLLKIAAWVIDTLHTEPGGNVSGFLMPHVNAKEIHELYSTKSRRVYFPDATWHFLVHSAANVARAFFTLHKHSHVMGDVNHGNCVVLADGTVKLIDCDSFGIKTGEKRHVCEVGVNTHLAPELQGQNLREIERTERHDNFGLAVIIFQLLFLGRHPFSGNFRAQVDLSLEQSIGNYLFAYSSGASEMGVIQPPGTLTLKDLPNGLAELFERAFARNGDRPGPDQWIEHLADLNNSLEQCSIHPGHQFSNTSVHCPWCRIESQTGVTFFPYISNTLADGEGWSLDVSTVEEMLDGLEQPLIPKRNAGRLPNPSPEIVEIADAQKKQYLAITTGFFFVLFFTGLIWGIGAAGLFGFVLLIPLILFVTSSNKSVRESLTSTLFDKELGLNEIELQLSEMSENDNVMRDIGHLRTRLKSYDEFVDETKLLSNGDHKDGLESHLQKHAVDFAPGISSELLVKLSETGITTAAEARPDSLAGVEWLEESHKTILEEWHADLVNSYEGSGNGSKALPKDDGRFRQQKTIELEVNALLNKINASNKYYRQNESGLIQNVEDVRREIRQLKSDIRKLGNGGVVVIILFAIAVFLPIFGAIIGETMPAKQEVIVPQDSSDIGGGTVILGSENTGIDVGESRTGNPILSVWELGVPGESISDQEIADLPISKRHNFAVLLHTHSEKLIREEGDLKTAIKRLEYALRFERTPLILDSLGLAHAFDGEWIKSNSFYLESAQDHGGETALHGLGQNYFELKEYKKAIETYRKLVAYTSKPEYYLLLGKSYSAVEKYKEAETTLRTSLNLESTDEVIFELGSVLVKQGKINQAKELVTRLKRLNQVFADSLEEQINNYERAREYPRLKL